ncbi:MAG: squalene synthase [Thermomicrobiales bacterium]|nr:MAG: squalene synthase [Thermomicrobiales bacterium]
MGMTTPWPDAPAADPWELCEAIAREHARTFYLASRFLPRHRRRAILAAYAYCRIADDLVDCSSDYHPALVSEALARWEDELMMPRHPVAVAFAHARRVFGVPIEPVRDLFTGIRMDLAGTRFATWSALYTYSYHVAGTIGMIVAPILGCNDPTALRYAAELGIAMQLTNILRDIGEDAQRGRVYLPLDELAAFGCDVEGMLRGQPGGQFFDLLTLQAQRARALYASAERGLRALPPRSRFTALVASRLYAEILTELERANFPVFQVRAFVSPGRKVMAMPGILASFVKLARPQRGQCQPQSHLALDGHRNDPHDRYWSSAQISKSPPHG